MTCQSCGAGLEPGAKFCKSCGESANLGAALEGDAPARRRSLAATLGAAAGVLGIAALVAILVVMGADALRDDGSTTTMRVAFTPSPEATATTVRGDGIAAPTQPTDAPETTPPAETAATTTAPATTSTTSRPVSRPIRSITAAATAERPSVVLRCDRDLPNPPRTFYGAAQLVDGDMDTGWGAGAGDGTGESVTLRLPGRHFVTAVGLTPGFAKIGPRFDAGCRSVLAFPHNGFVTQVRYTFDDGTALTQTFQRSEQLQYLDLEVAAGGPVLTSSVTITLLDVVFPLGSDPDTILSEAEVWGYPG